MNTFKILGAAAIGAGMLVMGGVANAAVPAANQQSNVLQQLSGKNLAYYNPRRCRVHHRCWYRYGNRYCRTYRRCYGGGYRQHCTCYIYAYGRTFWGRSTAGCHRASYLVKRHCHYRTGGGYRCRYVSRCVRR